MSENRLDPVTRPLTEPERLAAEVEHPRAAAKAIGCSRATVYRLMAAGELPYAELPQGRMVSVLGRIQYVAQRMKGR